MRTRPARQPEWRVRLVALGDMQNITLNRMVYKLSLHKRVYTISFQYKWWPTGKWWVQIYIAPLQDIIIKALLTRLDNYCPQSRNNSSSYPTVSYQIRISAWEFHRLNLQIPCQAFDPLRPVWRDRGTLDSAYGVPENPVSDREFQREHRFRNVFWLLLKLKWKAKHCQVQKWSKKFLLNIMTWYYKASFLPEKGNHL